MSRGAGDWVQAAALFDELAPLAAEQRRVRLEAATVPPEVRRWLDELLEAHDGDTTLLIDRQVDALARALAPEAPVLSTEEYVGQRFGPWQADAEIGRGGMGVVLGGRRADGQFEMRVAIKLLDPGRFGGATVEAIRRELRLLAALEHPGIARLIDGGVRADGLPYLVIEYIEGEPITAWAARTDPTVTSRVAVVVEAARAVAHCHARLVVHGDIKPGNVLIDGSGRVRLLDFGIASRLGEIDAETDEPAPSGWCSPGYAAPERLRGAPPAIAEDVFALGALLYAVLSGHGIRSASDQTRLLIGDGAAVATPPPAPSARLHADGRSDAARRVRGDLDVIVLRALAADPSDRYATVAELVDDLEAWTAHRPVRARGGGVAYRFRRWVRRHAALAGGLTVGALALIVGSGVALWQADRARSSESEARAAQVQAETALARADAVNRFLIDLFRARLPELPPDALPTTRQLMDRGIERARDPESGPVPLRVELLVTLAEILTARRQLDEADGLLDEADALIGSGAEIDAALRLRLAVARVETARIRNRLDETDARLARAIELYRQLDPDDSMRFELERDRGRVLMRRERFDEAEAMLLEVRDEVEARPALADLALRLAGDLAAVAGATGRHELAFQRFENILERKRALGHPAPSLATTEVNLANLASTMHRYDEADRRFGEVLRRLAPFTEVPRSVRAVAMKGRADIARIRGEFAVAADWLQRAADEWARVLDLESAEEDFFIHYYGARLDAARGRYSEAADRAAVAIERLEAGQEAPRHRIAVLASDRQRYLCRAGRTVRAEPDGVAEQGSDGPVRWARDDARAVCALLGGAEVDPEWVPEAYLAHLRGASGDVTEIARVERLRAALLAAVGRRVEADRLVESARERLDRAGVPEDHPVRTGWPSASES